MSLGLRVEDRLGGHTNYSVWKERMQSIFEEAEVWDSKVENYSLLIFHSENSSKLIFSQTEFLSLLQQCYFSVLGQQDVIGIEGGG